MHCKQKEPAAPPERPGQQPRRWLGQPPGCEASDNKSPHAAIRRVRSGEASPSLASSSATPISRSQCRRPFVSISPAIASALIFARIDVPQGVSPCVQSASAARKDPEGGARGSASGLQHTTSVSIASGCQQGGREVVSLPSHRVPSFSGARAAMTTPANPNPTVDELEKKEEELFRTGPLSVLTMSVKNNSQVGPAGNASRASGRRWVWAACGRPGRGCADAALSTRAATHRRLRRPPHALRRCSSTAATTASCWRGSRRLTGTAT